MCTAVKERGAADAVLLPHITSLVAARSQLAWLKEVNCNGGGTLEETRLYLVAKGSFPVGYGMLLGRLSLV